MVACVDYVEQELSIDELVGIWVVIGQVFFDLLVVRNFLKDGANTELVVARYTNPLNLVVEIILLVSSKQLLQELELARALVREVKLAYHHIDVT